MRALQNGLTALRPSGPIGRILAANEKNWIHPLLSDNPGLFAGFVCREDPDIFKTMWHGEFPGKLLTGIAQTYLLYNDPDTRRLGDRMAQMLKETQEECGYLGPWSEKVRFERDIPDPLQAEPMGKWDTWGQYHCIYGLYRWYQVSGNTGALKTALKALDHIHDHFIEGGRPLAAQKWAECNLAIGHAFALLYEETGREKYLKAAEHIVEKEWPVEYWDFYTKSLRSCRWMEAAAQDIPFYASGQPRWEGLYALETLAVLHRITGREIYARALESLWKGIRQTDRHNTGSFGTGEGAVGDVYGAWSETCNTVAWMALSTDYLKDSRDPLAADELELSFCNATLGSLLAGERDFTYANPSDGVRDRACETLKPHAYKGAPDMSCCQANGNRGLTQITEWALLGEGKDLYLNSYFPACMEGRWDGRAVTVRVESEYPARGQVRIQVECEEPSPVALHLRIPAWSEKTCLRLNGETLGNVSAGSYFVMERVWRAEDTVELELDMSLHFRKADCERLQGRVSAYQGPVLLACNEDARFTREALVSAHSAPGEGLIRLCVPDMDGQETVLTDYYSAGRNQQRYVSWLRCDMQ